MVAATDSGATGEAWEKLIYEGEDANRETNRNNALADYRAALELMGAETGFQMQKQIGDKIRQLEESTAIPALPDLPDDK